MFLLGLALFGDVISYIRCKDSARAHIFALHCASGVQTDLSSNSIQQHRVPAWPAGRPREYQHSLLVVQGSINQHTHLFSFTLFNLQPNNAWHRLKCVPRVPQGQIVCTPHICPCYYSLSVHPTKDVHGIPFFPTAACKKGRCD